MLARLAPLAIGLTLSSVTLTAHAQDVPPPPVVVHTKNPLAGTVLTSVGGSMLLGSPLVVLLGAAIAEAGGPYNTAAIGPFAVGAFGSACIGLGLLIPGIVMLATHKRAPHPSDELARPAQEPTWTDLRAPAGTPRAFAIQLLRTSF